MDHEKQTPRLRGKLFKDNSGVRYMVINVASHADDCDVKFVFYHNIDPTFDSAPGKRWCMELESFLERMHLHVAEKSQGA